MISLPSGFPQQYYGSDLSSAKQRFVGQNNANLHNAKCSWCILCNNNNMHSYILYPSLGVPMSVTLLVLESSVGGNLRRGEVTSYQALVVASYFIQQYKKNVELFLY